MKPQTRPIDVQDPTFLQWYDDLRRGEQPVRHIDDSEDLKTSRVNPDLLRAPDDPIDPREPDIPDDPGPSWPEPSRPPISNFYAYTGVGWNTCGQAAIASMLDYLGKDPFGLPRVVRGSDGRMHWDNRAIIDALKSAGFGPDVVFGFGTTGGRIRNALYTYGCNQAYEDHSGVFSSGWQDLWNRLKWFLRVRQTPVPVLVDLGALGGEWYTAHWPIAYRITASDDVYLANCPWRSVVDRRTFLHAWHCSFLPLGFNHCAVYYLPEWG